MANPVIESSNTNTGTSTDTLVIIKPTDLSVGDLLVVKVGLYDVDDNNANWNTPAGWTLETESSIGSSSLLTRTACFSKIADSSDVSASDFTFTASTTVGYLAGYLARISGQATPSINIAESDAFNGSTASLSYTTSLTPDTSTNSLIIFSFASAIASGSATTVSGYTSTPSNTWTELADLNPILASDSMVFAVVSANYDSASEITQRTATLSANGNNHASSAIVIRGTIDTTATPELVQANPTVNEVNVSTSVNVNVERAELTPQAFEVSASTSLTNNGWSEVIKTFTSTEEYLLEIGSGYDLEIGSGFSLAINETSAESSDWQEEKKST